MGIRVYIVEDHPVMRETLRDYLALTPDVELCGMAADAKTAAGELERANPSVVLLDLALPGRHGLDLLREIQRRWATPCIILSGHRERTYVAEALAAGASGYVLKGKPDEVVTALRCVRDGGMYLSAALGRPADYREKPSGA